MSTDGDRQYQPAAGPYRTTRPGRPDRNAAPPMPAPDAAIPPEWNIPVRTSLPPGTEWGRQLREVAAAAHCYAHFLGAALPNTTALLVPGDVVLLCTRQKKLRTFVFLPGDIWHRTDQPDVEWADGCWRFIRQHCRGWVAMSRSERILRACNEAIRDFQIARQHTTDLAELALFAEGVARYESLAAIVTGEVRQLTHQGLLRALDAWLEDVGAHANADREVVFAMLAEALEQDERTRQGAPDDTTTLSRDSPYNERLMAMVRLLHRLSLSTSDLQRYNDIANTNEDWEMEQIVEEAARRRTTALSLGLDPGAMTSTRPRTFGTGTRRSSSRNAPISNIPRTDSNPPAAPAPVRDAHGVFHRLARRIRIRQRETPTDASEQHDNQ